MTRRKITDAERRLLTHVSRFGSDGFPIRKLGGSKRSTTWTWGTDDVEGPPTLFKTKREAVASFEAFLGVLHDADAVEARSRAVLEILAACGGDEDAAADRIAAQTGFLRSYALVLVREVLP